MNHLKGLLEADVSKAGKFSQIFGVSDERYSELVQEVHDISKRAVEKSNIKSTSEFVERLLSEPETNSIQEGIILAQIVSNYINEISNKAELRDKINALKELFR